MEKNTDINLFNNLGEEDVGISQYIYTENPGFACVLKHRYTDFLVNEIDTEGNVVWLKSDKEKESTKENADNDQCVKPSISTDEDINSIIKNHFIDLNLITNEKDVEAFKEFLHKFLNKELGNEDKIYIDYIEDKNNRKIFHEKIREFFEFLNSETISELHGGSTFDNRNKNKHKGKYQRGGKKEKETTPAASEGISLGPNERKMVVFVNKNKTNFYKKRKVFPDNNKKVLHFSMLKRNMDTVQAISYIARILHRSNKTIKFAGNKDKRGITTQRISAFSTVPEELTSVTKQNFWDKRIEIDNFEFKEEELRLGLLKGNQFSVVFRFIDFNTKDTDINIVLEQSIRSLEEKGFINYFGMQRFGVGTVPTHKVGLNVLKKQWRDAVVCILSTQNIRDALRQLGLLKKIINEDGSFNYEKFATVFDSIDNITDLLKVIDRYSLEYRILSCIKKTGKNSFLTGFKTLNRQLQLLYPHAYQSYIWNMSVSERIKNHGLNVLVGDIVKKKTAKDTDIPEIINDEECECVDVENEEEDKKEENTTDSGIIVPTAKVELDVDKIFEDNYEYITEENKDKYTYDDLYFPVVGYKVKYPKNETFAYITELLKIDDVKLEDFAESNVNFNSTGYFRKMIEKPREIKYDIIRHDQPDEDLQIENYNVQPHPKPISVENKYTSLLLQFQLPQSTYATMLFRELTKKSSAVSYQANLSKNMQRK